MYRFIENALVDWAQKSPRKPLLIRGARQVGKSFTVEKFGAENFAQVIVVNFEIDEVAIPIFDELLPSKIIKKIELLKASKITPGETLLFLDEIQNCPKAILALRYFKEKMPDLHVIAAGSLLEFALKDLDFSFPVGRIQFLYFKPMSFNEFLYNMGESLLLEHIKQSSIKEPILGSIHDKLLDLVNTYLLTGGMPEAVSEYLNSDSFLNCRQAQTSLVQTYQNDFSKYATKSQYKYLKLLFEKAPRLIGKDFKFSKVDSEVRARVLKVALEQLSDANLIKIIYVTTGSGVPLKSEIKEKKMKICCLDVGLVQAALQLDYENIFSDDITQINSGAIAEQFVGQELLAYQESFIEPNLFYWQRDKKGALAEVDYVINFGTDIYPLEVKSGSIGRMRSIQVFLQEKNYPLGIRVSQTSLQIEKNILSVPFYMISELKRLVGEAQE